MKKEKKTIKEEIEEKFEWNDEHRRLEIVVNDKAIFNTAPVDKNDLISFLYQTIQRFIEETTKKAEKWDDLYNWDINRKVDELILKKKLLRKQQQWLKENLN